MKLKNRLIFGMFAAAVLGASAASANVLTFQNVTFTTTALSSNELQLTINNAPNASGDWSGVNYLYAIAMSSSATPWSFSSVSVSPSAGATYFSGGLGANGCSGAGAGYFCFQWSPMLSLTNNMVFDFTFNGAPSGGEDFSLPHLKLNFYTTNTTGSRKTGSLLSMDIPAGGSVPEPSAFALMAAGLLGLGWFVRQRRLS